MNIAVIGSGKVGGTLAKRFAEVGHVVFLGVRDSKDAKVKALLGKNITAHTIAEAAEKAEVIVTAAYPQGTKEIAEQLGDVSKKVIIDAMNTFRAKPEPYATTAEALLNWTNCQDIVRCFNSTGFENMANPNYGKEKADMFVAGDSKKAKDIAVKLAKEIGFGEVYDLGGNDAFELIEQIPRIWVKLARTQGYGEIAIKILKR